MKRSVAGMTGHVQNPGLATGEQKVTEGPAIQQTPYRTSHMLMALGSLWCSASEVVCMPQAWTVSDHYFFPDLCMLGSGMALLAWSNLQSL